MTHARPCTRSDAVEQTPRISLYVTYTHPTKIAVSDLLFPIQAGRSLSTTDLALPGDNSGEHISHKNGSYCELTTQFWVWKNDRASDIVGFFHYRRFLDLSGADRRTNVAGWIPAGAVSEKFVERYGLTREQGCLLENEFDVISPWPVDVKIHGAKSVEEQYERSPDHFIDDLLQAGEVMRDLYPSDFKYFEATMQGRSLLQHNVYIMRRDVFEYYSEWLFAILGELEHRIDISAYSLAGRRVHGYVAERLFTVFARKLQTEGKKVVFANLVFVDGMSPWQRAKSRLFVAWQLIAATCGPPK